MLKVKKFHLFLFFFQTNLNTAVITTLVVIFLNKNSSRMFQKSNTIKIFTIVRMRIAVELQILVSNGNRTKHR